MVKLIMFYNYVDKVVVRFHNQQNPFKIYGKIKKKPKKKGKICIL